jgi:hypothetical protein
MRRLRRGPLATAVAIPVSFALLGAALVGGSGLGWYAGLAKPWFLVPLWAFYLVGLVYYVLGGVVLYRVLLSYWRCLGRTRSSESGGAGSSRGRTERSVSEQPVLHPEKAGTEASRRSRSPCGTLVAGCWGRSRCWFSRSSGFAVGYA